MEIDSETIPPSPSAVQRETKSQQLQLIQLLQQIQFLQETYPETLQLDIKGLLGPDKLYKKQKGIKIHKEQPEKERDQRDSQATFQP